jgi:hypothetical protein
MYLRCFLLYNAWLDIIILTLFHLGECHKFPSKWPSFGEGF